MNARTRLLLSLGIPLLLIIIVLGALLWRQQATGSGSTTQGQQKLTKLSLALDWTPNTNHTGIFVALQKGWYRAQGIDLTILPYSSNVSPDTLVSSGKADVGISATEGVVSDMAAGQPVVSIGAILQHNTSALASLAGVGLDRPREFDGKTYGGFGAPYETAVVSEIIRKDGGKGNFKNVTIDIDAVEALKTHKIDFVWLFVGWQGIQAQREGVKLNYFSITNYGVADYYTPTFIASPTEVKQKADLLHRFMAATSQGYEFARSHAHEAAQILIDENKGAFPDTGLVFASQDYLSPRYADAGRKWGLQDSSAWHTYPQFMLDSGGIEDAAGKPVQSMNFDALYTNQFLP